MMVGNESSIMDRRHIPSLSALFALEAAIRSGNYTQAANDIGVTQGAVSRQIKQLEEILGTKLFIKDGRNVRATEAAVEYHAGVQAGLQEIANATQKILNQQGSSAVRLGVLPTTSSRWLVPRLSSFIEANAQTSVVLSVQIKPFDFAYENVDAAIHCGTPDWPGVEYDLLMMEEVAVVCSPQLEGEGPIGSKADLLRYPLIVTSTREDDWSKYFAGMEVDVVSSRNLEFETFTSASKAAVAGLGIAIIPVFLMEKELEAGELVIPYGGRFTTSRGYYLVYPKDRLTYESFRKFRHWLIKEARDSSKSAQAKQ